MSEKKKVILIGAGLRGMGYTDKCALHGGFEVIAVAEPIESRRNYVKNKHGISEQMSFESWEGLLALGKIADAAIIATMDREHFAPAMAAMELGYDLLLEKPAAPTAEECVLLSKKAKEKGVKVLVCHVLRYTPAFRAIKELISSSAIGEVVNIHHLEAVEHVHQTHSFVRGNWGNSERSSFMLLQKSCHDMDILQWLIGKKCLRVHSFGSNYYFNEKNAPEGAPEFCYQGCKHAQSCPYNAVKIYSEDGTDWFKDSAAKKVNPGKEDLDRAIRETNYGRCVFKCDNDVVDHQTVNLEFEGGITAAFTMSAFNTGGRKIHIMGTKGDIIADLKDKKIVYNNFISGESREIEYTKKVTADNMLGGHGGGDLGIINSFYDMLSGKESDDYTYIDISAENHMIAFAAERSRLEGRVVLMSEFENI